MRSLVLSLLALSPFASAQTATYLQGGDPFGVYFENEDLGWVTHDGGLIRRWENGSWTQAVTPDVRVQLRGIDMVTPNVGYAVGAQGTVLRTTDGGLNWTQQSVVMSPVIQNFPDSTQDWPSAPANLHQCHFFDEVYGFVLGDDLTVQYTLDGGMNWIPADLISIENFLDGDEHESPFDCYDVHFFDDDNGIMVLDEGWIARTTDAGRTWVSRNGLDELNELPEVLPSCNNEVTNLEMWSIDFYQDGDPNTSDEYGVIAGGFGNNDGYTFWTDDGGATWTPEKCINNDFGNTTGIGAPGGNPQCGVTMPTIYGAAMLTADTSAAVGYGRTSWIRQPTPAPSTATWFEGFLTTVWPDTDVRSCAGETPWWNLDSGPAPSNPTLGQQLGATPMRWVEGYDNDTAYYTGTFGVVERVDYSLVGGEIVGTRTQLNSTQHGRMFGAAFTASGLGFQVGQSAQILRTSNFGEDTERVFSSPANNNPYLLGVDVADNGTWVLAAGNEDPLYNTQGGDPGHWNYAPLGLSVQMETAEIIGSTSVGYIAGAGGQVYRTSDQGANWLNRSLPLTGIKVLDTEFLTAEIGMVVGTKGTAAFTTNGGQNWTSVAVPTLPGEALTGISLAFPHIVTVSDTGKIYYANAANLTFIDITPSIPELANASLMSVDINPDTLEVWASGKNGALVKLSQGTWTAPRPMTIFDLNTVMSIDASTTMISSRRSGLARF